MNNIKKVALLNIFFTLSIFPNVAKTIARTSELIQSYSPFQFQQQPFSKGSINIICGSMCSGKSEELIKKVSRYVLAGFDVLIFKPTTDTRQLLKLDLNPLEYISSRNGSWINCVAVSSVEEMEEFVVNSTATIIAIDEVHFFTSQTQELIELVHLMLTLGKKIIIAGLDLDFRGEPFGPMPQLLALADTVEKLTAICSVCGDDTYCISQRLVNGQPAHYHDPLIVVGSSQYEPRCRKCHIIRKD